MNAKEMQNCHVIFNTLQYKTETPPSTGLQAYFGAHRRSTTDRNVLELYHTLSVTFKPFSVRCARHPARKENLKGSLLAI